MDPTDDARRLRDEYEAAMDQAEARRAEYHRAVAELHRSGMPMREIAKQLGISHQRVHQIVSGEPSRPSPRAKVVGGTVAAIILAASLGLSIVAAVRTTHPVAAHRPLPRVVAVPNLLGMASQQAFDALGRAGLQPAGVSTAYSTTLPSGTILSEEPPAGTKLRVGSGVNLVESKGVRSP